MAAAWKLWEDHVYRSETYATITVKARSQEEAIRKAMTYGSVVASFGVEKFSLDRLAKLNRREIEARAAQFRKMGRIA